MKKKLFLMMLLSMFAMAAVTSCEGKIADEETAANSNDGKNNGGKDPDKDSSKDGKDANDENNNSNANDITLSDGRVIPDSSIVLDVISCSRSGYNSVGDDIIRIKTNGTFTIDQGDGSAPKTYNGQGWHVIHFIYSQEGTRYTATIKGNVVEVEKLSFDNPINLAIVGIYVNSPSLTRCRATFRNGKDALIKKAPVLTYLYLDGNSAGTLDISGCPNLETLKSWLSPDVQNIDLSNFPKLKYLELFGSQLTSLDISKCTNLTDLSLDGNPLTSLDVSKCTNLKNLRLYNSQLTSLDVSKCSNLTDLELYNNPLTNLDVSGTLVQNLSFIGNSTIVVLTNISINGGSNLKSLDFYDNRLTSLDLSKCTNLTRVSLYQNQLTETVLNNIFESLNSTISGLGNIYISYNPGTSTCNKSIAEAKGWQVIY